MRCHNYNHHNEVIRVFKCKRKGVALITVILISALLFVSIIGITLKVVPENKIIAARSASQRALEAAETGLSQIAFDLRNTHFEEDPPVIEPTDLFHYLKIDEVENIPKLLIGSVISSFSEGDYIYSSGPPYVRYKVKIKKTGGYVNPSWIPTSVIDDKIKIEVYALGTVYKDSSTSDSSVLARRAVSAEYEISFSQKTGSVVFDYALFSGGKIDFTGGSDVTIGGNIFANGDITFNGDCTFNKFWVDLNKDGIQGEDVNKGVDEDEDGDEWFDSTVYANDGLKGSGYGGDYNIPPDNPDEIPFSSLNLQYYQDLANAFKTGSPPYDGSDANYPNISALSELEKAIIFGSDYLGNSDPITGIKNFYWDLVKDSDHNDHGNLNNLDPLRLVDLATKAKYIVYYIDGKAQIKDDFYCEGVIAINGKLVITGSGSVNPGVSIPNLSLLVKDDIQINNNAQLNGLIYTEGHLQITGGSNIIVTGSLVSKYDVSLNNIASITYVPLDVPNTSITGAAEITTVEQTSSSWKEISFDEF